LTEDSSVAVRARTDVEARTSATVYTWNATFACISAHVNTST